MKRQLLFALCLFFAAASAVSAQTLPTVDHFQCYFTPSTALLQRTVILQDQFDTAVGGSDTIQDLRMVRLCNPVQKTTDNGSTTRITNPQAHLMLYYFTPEAAVARQVLIRNQFGTHLLYTADALILAVPTGKVVVPPCGTPSDCLPPQPPPIPTGLDHFKCYVASGIPLHMGVVLTDQFTPPTCQDFL